MENQKTNLPAEASQGKPSAEKPRELKGRYTVSRVFPNGSIADMVYEKDTGKAAFAIAEHGEVSVHDTVMVGEEGNIAHDPETAVGLLAPTKLVRELVDKNFIYLASKPEEYGTIQELHQQVRAHIEKHMVLEDTRFYDVAAGYVLMSWVFDRFSTVPYLRVVGDLGTGKSRFLKVVGKLCNRSMLASGSISMAAVYRTLDVVQGTLVFDEADFKSSDMSDEIVKLLNGGHEKDTPVVRMEVTENAIKTVTFRVFGPKILGSRRSFSDTALESRCITQRLFPLKKVGVSVHLPPTFDAEAQTLRNKLLMFRLKNFHLVQDDETSLGGLDFPRLKQTALALTSVVKMIGEDTLKPVLEFLVDCEQALLNTVATDPLADVLLCIARVMETDKSVRESGVLHMGTIAHAFNQYFYEDYADRETRTTHNRDNVVLSIPGQRVSARKIGNSVDKLGIAKARDSHGMYIPLRQEGPRIQALLERYRLVDVLNQDRLEQEEQDKNPKKTPREEFVEDVDKPF